jgi:hypothetical protein
MAYSNEADDKGEVTQNVRRREWLGKLLIPVGIAGHVLFYDALPVFLAWGVGAAGGLDLFVGFDNPSLGRVATLGVFLSAVAAVMTTESVTRMARPFGVGQFLTTAVVMGVALFPFLAEWHRVRLGLTAEQFAILQSYCYLALRVMVGILIGATVSWILLARYTSLAASPRPQYSRK